MSRGPDPSASMDPFAQTSRRHGGPNPKRQPKKNAPSTRPSDPTGQTQRVDAASSGKSTYSDFRATTITADPFGAFGGDNGIDSQIWDAKQPIITSVQPNLGLGSRADSIDNRATTKTGDELLRGLFTMSKDELKALQQKLIDAGAKGIDVTGLPDLATRNAYQSLIQSVQLQQSANPSHPMTIDDLLDATIAARKAAGVGGDKTTTEKSTSVDLTDPTTARQTLESAMSTKLGRKPTDWEIAQFTGALNAYEQQNPTVTDSTVTTSTDSSGNTTEKSRNTKTTGKSVNASAYALQYINDNHGPEQQAINHMSWYNVALDALQNGPVNTGLST